MAFLSLSARAQEPARIHLDYWEEQEALLLEHGYTAALESLDAVLLSDQTARLKYPALVVLEDRHQQAAVATLLRFVESEPEAHLLVRAAAALARLGNRRGFELLKDQMTIAYENKPYEAPPIAATLAKCLDFSGWTIVVDLAGSDDAGVRAAVARSLSPFATSETDADMAWQATGLLFELAGDEKGSVRRGALSSLYSLAKMPTPFHDRGIRLLKEISEADSEESVKDSATLVHQYVSTQLPPPPQ